MDPVAAREKIKGKQSRLAKKCQRHTWRYKVELLPAVELLFLKDINSHLWTWTLISTLISAFISIGIGSYFLPFSDRSYIPISLCDVTVHRGTCSLQCVNRRIRAASWESNITKTVVKKKKRVLDQWRRARLHTTPSLQRLWWEVEEGW